MTVIPHGHLWVSNERVKCHNIPPDADVAKIVSTSHPDDPSTLYPLIHMKTVVCAIRHD